jgi:magnesium chelatase family protein
MLSKVLSASIIGIEGFLVQVEIDISGGLPDFLIVGLPDTAVKESRERVKAAIKNSQLQFPTDKIIVNLAPADVKKEGPAFDLPIAIGILKATEQIKADLINETLVLGELSLDGRLRGVNGVLPIASSAKAHGIKRMIVPVSNAQEAALVGDIKIIPVESLRQVVDYLNGQTAIPPFVTNINEYFAQAENLSDLDFSDVKGHENIKRAIEVAVAGHHNLLMVGPPGSGKTMIARRIPTIMPKMTLGEALEVTKIYSCSGLLSANKPLLVQRPFRAPHHTISNAGMVGGGRIPKPGEISLAHYGVLFLDEIPEFHRDVLEVLRQPLEDGKVTVSRAQATITYPASFMLVGSMNPCPCGFFGDPTKECRCSPYQIQRYLGKLSGPLMDRIDIHVEVPAIKYKDLEETKEGECSEKIRKRVEIARNSQLERFKKNFIYFNSQMSANQIKKYCTIDTCAKRLLETAFKTLGLSARSYNRILKVSRTIADLECSDNIKEQHIAEAIQYRDIISRLRV